MGNIRSLNRVILIGRVGRNPEITHIPNTGSDVAKFSLVTNEGYYNQNREWKENAEWHNIVAWRKMAQKTERSVAKGDMVMVEGKIKTRRWTDQNSQERKITEIEAINLVVLDKKNRATSSVEMKNFQSEKDMGDYPTPPVDQAPPEEDIDPIEDFPESEEDPF